MNGRPPPAADRDVALDATKGVLVVLMVAYHTLNYSTQYYLAFRYLSFLPPSFIFLTGYLLTKVYASRASSDDWGPTKRTLARGARLVLVFTFLNVVAHLFVRRNRLGERVDLSAFFGHWREVYLSGSGRAAVFEVLLPIGYLLLCAPVILWLAKRGRPALAILAGSLAIACAWLEWEGYTLGNLNLLSAGILGTLAGQLPSARTRVLGRWWVLAAVAYGATAWYAVSDGVTYPVQVAGTISALGVIYGLCLNLRTSSRVQALFVRLGQYSLVAYIAQIAILQALSRVAGRPDPFSLPSAGLFAATALATTAIVEVLGWARRRSRPVDFCYRVLFA